MFQKTRRFESKKLRGAAKGQSCVCCGAQDGTVVGAHLAPAGHDWGSPKVHDWLIAWLCSDCHYKADHGEYRRDYGWRTNLILATL